MPSRGLMLSQTLKIAEHPLHAERQRDLMRVVRPVGMPCQSPLVDDRGDQGEWCVGDGRVDGGEEVLSHRCVLQNGEWPCALRMSRECRTTMSCPKKRNLRSRKLGTTTAL